MVRTEGFTSEADPTQQTGESAGGTAAGDADEGKSSSTDENKSSEDKEASPEVIAARQETARNFYKKAGWSDSKIEQHMAGIYFTKPVEVVNLPEGQALDQWVHPKYGIGNYFAEPGTPASDLGIWQGERVLTPLKLTQEVQALKSTAAPVVDTWSDLGPPVVPHPTNGGGTQYFTLPPLEGTSIAGPR